MRAAPKALLEPWAITEEGMHRVVDVWARARRGEEVFGSLEKAREEWKSRPRLDEPGDPVEGTGGTLRVVDGVGVISIVGTLFRHANLMTNFSGGASYDAIWSGLEKAKADPSVKAILLRFDSPGGEANGCGELGDYIAKLAADPSKTVWAYAEGMCCSAAYWLASQTSRIVAHRTAMIGSIGVRIGIVDDSKATKNAGLRVIDMVSSGAPNKRGLPIDDEVLARAQTHLDDLEALFIDAVADGRGVGAEKVREEFGQGDYMVAGKALAAGMIDEENDFNGTLLALRDAEQPTKDSFGVPQQQPGAALNARSEPMPAEIKAAAEEAKKATAAKAAEERADESDKDDEDEKDAPRSKKAKSKSEGDEPDMEDGDEPAAEGDEEERCEDEDDDEEGEHDEPDGDEAKARASLAALAGVSPKSKLSAIAATLVAKTQPLTEGAALRKENAELRTRLDALEGDKHKATAKAFVAQAIADGRTVEEKRAHLEKEFAKAEKAKAGAGSRALEPQLFAKGTFTVARRMTLNGSPVGKPERKPLDLSQDSPEDVRAAYAARVAEIAKAEKISYAAATARVREADPDLHASFKALG